MQAMTLNIVQTIIIILLFLYQYSIPKSTQNIINALMFNYYNAVMPIDGITEVIMTNPVR